LLTFLLHAARMKRLESFDGLRGVLAVYVLLGHMAPFAVLPDALQAAVSHGGAAVDVFFVLSGLVITQSLLHAGGQAAPFLVTRVARIFPVFLAVFAVAVLVQPWSCGFENMPWVGQDDVARAICVSGWPRAWLPEIAAHLTMTHGLFPYAVWPHVWVSFLGAAWSLSTEWQFYMLALIVFGQNRRLCWILLLIAAAGLAWRLTVPIPWQFSRAFLPNKAHFFALGVATVPLMAKEYGALRRYLVVLAASLAICMTEGNIGKLLPPLVWSVCLAVQMRPEVIGLRQVNALLSSRIGRYLGAISYCLYLVNEPIQKVVGESLSRFADGNGTLFNVFWIPLSIGLPLLVAAWLHAYLEAPALRRGREFARRLSARRAVATVQALV
jgi:peptidoglycan/LPS O-acetylase OafA/YrhL